MTPFDASASVSSDMSASPSKMPGRALRAVPDPPAERIAKASSSMEEELLHAARAHGEDGHAFGGRAPGQLEPLRGRLQDRLNAYVARGRARVVLTDNVHTMLTVKRGQGVLTFRMHHMFVEAPSPIVRALARYAEQRDREASELLRYFIDANDVKIRARAQMRPVAVDVQGKFHNLHAMYDAINEQYFDKKIRARITWGPRGKRRARRGSIRLGSYTVEDELIRIHPVLDAKDVPDWFVSWIVYHEMLHEVHDMPIVNGRRVYHTREFREAEACFEHFEKCVRWERENLDRMLTR